MICFVGAELDEKIYVTVKLQVGESRRLDVGGTS